MEQATALINEAQKNKKLDGPVYMTVALKSPPVKERQHNPILIPLPHRTRRSDELSVCLVVKDPAHKIGNQILESELVNPLFDEVIGVGKLRRRLKNSKQRIDEFAKSFNVIFVQDKVASALIEALGLHFYKHARSLPIIITLGDWSAPTPKLDEKKIRYQVRLATKATQLILKPNNQVTVLVGNTKMDAKILSENIKAAHQFCVKKFDSGAKYHIKTPESVSLPL